MAALDLGEVRTGVAISDATRSLATPLAVVPSGELEAYLRRLVDEEGVSEVVVGIPRTMSGETGFQAEQALEGLRRLREAFPQTSFVEWDERLTTRLASPGAVKPGGKGGSRRRQNRKRDEKERVDHLAAARLLQEYLDRRG